MNITCSTKQLLLNINLVIKAVSGKTTMPILECILLFAKDGIFKLYANDLEMAIESSEIGDTKIKEEGSIALDAKIFSEIIRKFPQDSKVDIYTNHDNITTIICEKSEFKILGLSGEEFPTIPLVEKNEFYYIKAIDFKNLIRKTIFSVSPDDSKPIITGELIDIKDKKIVFVAVDGYRVALASVDIETPNKDTNIVVPAKTLSEISKIISNNEEEIIKMYITDKHVLFETENCKVISRLLEGDFIKYEQVFINDCTTMFTANKTEIIMALERASLIASKEIKKSPIKLKIEDELLLITSKTQFGTAKEEVKINSEGNTLEIAFNPRYLIEAIKAIEEDTILMQFMSPLSPCIIKPTKSENVKYLVLPLRLE